MCKVVGKVLSRKVHCSETMNVILIVHYHAFSLEAVMKERHRYSQLVKTATTLLVAGYMQFVTIGHAKSNLLLNL